MKTRSLFAAVSVVCAAAAATTMAQSNVSSINKYAWSENCGWMNWRDAGATVGAQGVRVHATFLSGWIWMENVGWVTLGDGTPAGGSSYANPITGPVFGSPDFGVNRGPDGVLTGFAWSENAGWINFSGGALAVPAIPARLDVTAQRFFGYAWSENVGWISLDNLNTFVGVDLPPANDECGSAVAVGLGATIFNSTSAITDGPAHNPACLFFGNDQIGSDVWFTHTSAADGMLVIDTCGSAYDTKMAVYSGPGCIDLVSRLMACNDDAGLAPPDGCGINSLQSRLSIAVSAGGIYTIRVGGYNNLTGPGQLTLTFAVSTGACCCGSTCGISTAAACNGSFASFAGVGTVCNAFGVNDESPCCFADYNQNGAVTVQDIFDFLAAYFGQDGCADINASGPPPSVQDIFDFLAAYFAGCL